MTLSTTCFKAHSFIFPRRSTTTSSSFGLHQRRTRNSVVIPPRFPFACRAANNNNENPFASLQHIRSTLADKPELAVKKKERRSMEIDEFAYEEENKTKKATNAKKAVPTSSPSKNSKGVRIKVERRKNKVVTVVSGLENPTKELVTKLKKVLGAGASLDVDRRACIFQGTHANALEDMIKAMGYKDVKIVK